MVSSDIPLNLAVSSAHAATFGFNVETSQRTIDLVFKALGRRCKPGAQEQTSAMAMAARTDPATTRPSPASRRKTACLRKPPPGWRIPKSWRRYPVFRKGGGGAGGNRDRGVRGVEIRRPSRVGD
ncbi:hypothetical protein PZA11_004800 [Diplocarpon coronariae]